jgi:PAS domain S-box-containing protein
MRTKALESLVKLSYMTSESEEKVGEFALRQAIDLTNSHYGFINFITDQGGTVTPYSYSKEVMAQCATEPPKAFNVCEGGLWAEAVRKKQPFFFNDYHMSHPAKKGIPEGHVQITRFMAVPIQYNEDVVLIAAMANKAQPYDKSDADLVLILMKGLWDHILRCRREKSLRESHESFKAIANYTYDLETWHAPDGKLIWINPAVKKHTGYSVTECKAISDFPLSIIHTDDRHKIQLEFWQSLIEQGSINDLRFRIIRKDGETTWMSISWQPIYDSEGQYLGLRASARDVNERVAMENFRADLERITRHDMRSPLVSAVHAMQILQSQPGLKDDQIKIVKTVERVCSNMLSMLSQYIKIYQIESEQYDLNAKPIDLRALILEIYDELISLEHNRLVNIKVEGHAEAFGEKDLCRTLFYNLINNALEALPENDETVKICLTNRDDQAQIQISNPGEVPKDIRHCFFDRYATSGKKNGTGLGTYSARIMARVQGGDILLDTTSPGFTTVIVYLPQ